MSKKPKLYIGIDTQDLKWNLVCGIDDEPVWVDKVSDYDAAGIKRSLEFARIKCGYEYDNYEPVLLFEDIPWEGAILEFFTDNGITAHILDDTCVPADLSESINEEGYYPAEVLYKILIRRFVKKERGVLRTRDVNHGFVDEIKILKRERRQVRKEYKRHIARIRSLISQCGCKTKSPQTCRFDRLYNKNDEPIPLYHRARLERQRKRAELVIDQFYVVDDEFRDCLQANIEMGRDEGKITVSDPDDMHKAGSSAMVIDNKKVLERTDPEILLDALKVELKKIRREKNSHKSQVISWLKEYGVEVDKDAEIVPAALRIDKTHKLPRALIMLLRRMQERQAMATEQYEEIEELIKKCQEKLEQSTE